MKQSSRALALASLCRWRTGTEFADQIVADTFARSALRSTDRAFALELFYGLLRNLTLLDFWITQLRSAPVDSTSRDILRLGLYQLLLIETAAHAAVFETVELAPPRARGLINALLRRALCEKDHLTKLARALPLAAQFSEPKFLVKKWTQQFGTESAIELCRWNNQPATVHARINPLKISAAAFMQKYPGSVSLGEHAGFVDLPEPAAALANGDCYIQDPSTALACELLQPSAGETVLDACAAPGGKSAYLAGMMMNRGTLISADRDEARLPRLRGNLVRLGVTNATIVRCNWLDAESIRAAAFQPQSFYNILLDAPCSNTGVMRRRVDVRWRLRPEDFTRMRAQQLAILENVAPLLKPGGSLVYSTCSLEPEENEEVVAAFLRTHPAFRLTRPEQTLPFREGIDGAFAAKLQKTRG
ncbi:MAG: 16S rRNA (cytosine(967)-C(5))-methyltransferase RsmB [Chthoniobacterales bacterium]|nr:16S rRNA (cytosine(967)-C(5))-methyltransferase RsmB [Chthoniobacterales bacterium]